MSPLLSQERDHIVRTANKPIARTILHRLLDLLLHLAIRDIVRFQQPALLALLERLLGSLLQILLAALAAVGGRGGDLGGDFVREVVSAFLVAHSEHS